MLEINLKQLESFVATVEHSGFTAAAAALYLTQSTVSAHVSALEQTLGVPLLVRGARRPVTLTSEGQNVYVQAREILNRCERLQALGPAEQPAAAARSLHRTGAGPAAGAADRLPAALPGQPLCPAARRQRAHPQPDARVARPPRLCRRGHGPASLRLSSDRERPTRAHRPEPRALSHAPAAGGLRPDASDTAAAHPARARPPARGSRSRTICAAAASPPTACTPWRKSTRRRT